MIRSPLGVYGGAAEAEFRSRAPGQFRSSFVEVVSLVSLGDGGSGGREWVGIGSYRVAADLC